MKRAYEDATTDALKQPGWFRKSHNATVAGNNAFREVYDQVWNGFIKVGEAAGVRRYLVAVAKLQGCCDTKVKKQSATDVLTLYQDAARVQPWFKTSMRSLVKQCKQAAEKEARRAFIKNVQKVDCTTALRQRLKTYFTAADADNNGKLSRSELRDCLLRAAQGVSVSNLTRNALMTGEQQQRQTKAVVCDLKVNKAWKRNELCSHWKRQHLDSLSRVVTSREQWILDTVLCGEPFALQQNMFPFDLSVAAGDSGDVAVEHWVFWSANPDPPPLQDFIDFVSSQLHTAHAATGCSWGFREFDRRDSIPGLFHAHVFCRPNVTNESLISTNFGRRRWHDFEQNMKSLPLSHHPLVSALKKCEEPAHIAAFGTKIINTAGAFVVRKTAGNNVKSSDYEILTRCYDSSAGRKVFCSHVPLLSPVLQLMAEIRQFVTLASFHSPLRIPVSRFLLNNFLCLHVSSLHLLVENNRPSATPSR